MFANIVVGTDGSETAGVALHRAVELASLCGGTLHIVNAFRPVTAAGMANAMAVGAPTFDVGTVNEGIEQASNDVLTHAARQAEGKNVKYELHSVPGDPADVLIDIAQQCHADLIVIGNRGMTGARRFFLGSVPNKISHHAPCSLLIVDTGE